MHLTRQPRDDFSFLGCTFPFSELQMPSIVLFDKTVELEATLRGIDAVAAAVAFILFCVNLGLRPINVVEEYQHHLLRNSTLVGSPQSQTLLYQEPDSQSLTLQGYVLGNSGLESSRVTVLSTWGIGLAAGLTFFLFLLCLVSFYVGITYGIKARRFWPLTLLVTAKLVFAFIVMLLFGEVRY